MRILHCDNKINDIKAIVTAVSSDIDNDNNDNNISYHKLKASTPLNGNINGDSINGHNNNYQQHQSQKHNSSFSEFHRITTAPYINNNSLTKCAKMTEEHAMIRNGSNINGVGITSVCSTPSPPLPSTGPTVPSVNNNKLPFAINNSNGQTTGVGGRLQFFKGKL